ncbi:MULTISPECIES: TolB family protein [Aphanothece]|uniref:TolB family protein n=1 Tax=Aphanothece TaxID=1121 RepID=UPI0039852CD8
MTTHADGGGNAVGEERPRGLPRLATLLAPLLLTGCLAAGPVSLVGINRQLEPLGANRDPSLSGNWLALISGSGGRERVVLVDLQRQRPVPVPGLNRPDAQPIHVSVDSRGERLALVRQLEGRTELVIYRRSLQGLQPLPIVPPGVPRQVHLRPDGRELAVQVSRQGLWQIDLIQVP